MRDAGVTPTMQRLAILEYLEGTKSHPTADEVYAAVHKTCPTIARATVYNTLEALTRSGTILQLTVDPAAARYDADTGPHMHLRCRICGKVYDIDVKQNRCLGGKVDGHQVESVRTYAFGVCASCRGETPPVGEPSSAKHEGSSTRKSLAKNAPESSSKRRPRNAPVAEKEIGTQKVAAQHEPNRQRARTASASDPIRSRKGGSPHAP